MAHSLKHFRCGRGATDIPVFVLRIGADDEEVVRCGSAAVASSCGEHNNVAGVDGERFATFAAKDEVGVTGGKA